MNASVPASTSPQEVWQRPFVKAHQKWCDDFVLELRLRDVPGPVIGDRLAEVERHCAETGQTPAVSFGDPTAYATGIDQNSSPERVPGVWRIAAVSSVQVLAMLVGTAAVPAWTRGEPLTYNAAQIACLGLVLLPLLLLPLLLRPLVRHPWTIGLPLVTAVLLAAGGAALSGRSELPAVVQLPAPVVTVGLFVAVLVLAWIEYRELVGDARGDLVTSPLTPTGAKSAASRRGGRLTAVLPACLVPASYLAVATVSWLAV